MITIHNLYTETIIGAPYEVRVDRKSPLGNPFHMKRESDRDMVCDEYDVLLRRKVSHGQDVRVRNELNRLYRLYKQHGCLMLFCWCAPNRCHAETIKAILMEALERC